MTTYTITNRWTDAVIYIAEIEADDDTLDAIKLGRAIIQAIEAGAKSMTLTKDRLNCAR